MNKKFLTIVSLIIIATASLTTSGFGLLKSPTAFAVGDLTIDWGVPTGNPIFVVTNFLPGDMEQHSVDVTNNATVNRTVAVKGILVSDTDSLSNALEIIISESGNDLYGGTAGSKTLTNFFNDSSSLFGIPLMILTPSQTKTLNFKVQFKPQSGNGYQLQTVIFDIQLGITQDLPQECTGISFSGPPIFGTSGRDRIRGTNGNDLIFALEGSDDVYGGIGDDCIVGGPGNDHLDGSNGRDVILGGEGNDRLDGSNGQDRLFGGEGNDNIDGSNNEDYIDGGGGNDTMDGSNNNDEIIGGAGIDRANGGGGIDTCDAENEKKCEIQSTTLC